MELVDTFRPCHFFQKKTVLNWGLCRLKLCYPGISFCKRWLNFSYLLCQDEHDSDYCRQVRFASFFYGGLIIAKVVNKPERKLAKCTSVYCTNKKLVKEFLTAILHRGLKPDVFSSADLLFPFFIWTFILFFYWTFISLFYLDIFIFFFLYFSISY